MSEILPITRDEIVDFTLIKKQFPTLKQSSNGKPLCYLDSGASALKPQCVIDAMSEFYQKDYANVHRGVYQLSQRASDAYEAVRDQVQRFLNAKQRQEIIFTSGTTAAINLVASTFGVSQIKEGDEIVLSVMEHHSNIVPWQILCEQKRAHLKIIRLKADGSLDLEHYNSLLNSKTKLVAVTHVSNVLGTVNPIKQMAAIAHKKSIPILIDGAQAVPRMPVDVQDLDCDFYVFSAHKTYGPTGVGVLYAKRQLLEAMPPYQGGGDMILSVSFEKTIYNELPYKFEAGTPNIAGVIGLGAAINFINSIGLNAIWQHELRLTRKITNEIAKIPGLTFYGTAPDKVGVVSFTLDAAHPHDIGTILDSENVAVRAGHHCAMPLIEYYKIPGTVRASLGVYNDEEDVAHLMRGLHQVIEIFGG